MKGDFTSIRNGHHKGYTGVLRQQGRVDLDADWNEYVGIQEHLRRTIEKDVIGACGVPRHGAGFAVGWDAGGGDLTISPGRIYVDGILCELEGESSYLGQPNYPGRPALNPVDGRTDLIYLDVWQRHVTAVEDPAIREKALGGPDTTTRLQTVWQVKVLEGVGEVGCADEIQDWPPAPGTGRLSTQEKTAVAPEDPCLIAPGGGYRGLENRLYRVEIHRATGPGGPATFKWSRDNGSVVFPIASFVPGEPTKVIVSRLGRDQVLALREGDWVEVSGDDPELNGAPGLLTRIETIDRAGRVLTLAHNVSSVSGQRYPKVRRWDQTETEDAAGLTEGARRVREDVWLDLEDGVQVRFKSGERYRSGDYWAFAARTATGEVERLVEAGPRGVDHHYCRLALVTWSVDGTVDAEVQDCRNEFPPLTELPTGGASCCTVTVGDGRRSEGDFTDIQAAVDFVRGPGRVCILPGEYRLAEPVVIRARGLVVSGCGIQARIVGPEDEPAFQVEESLGIWLGSLYIEPRSTTAAIAVNNSSLVYVKDCFVSRRQLFPEAPDAERVEAERPRILRAVLPREVEEEGVGPSLAVSSSSHVVVADNYFLAGTPSLSIQARDLRILRNVTRGAGGVWIRDGSSGVRIEANDIGEGQGPGIELGGLTEGETSPVVATGVVGVDIVGNRIFSMGDSGIDAGTAAKKSQDDDAEGLGDVEDVKIARNRIVGCARRQRGASSEFDAVGGIVLNDASRVLIHENHIAENGEGPACGVFAHTCQGLEVTDNTIIDNGTAQTGGPQRRCVDFRQMSTGEGDNPRTEQDMRFTVFERRGSPSNRTVVVNWGGMRGLNCRVQTEIDLPAPTPLVELTLATFAGSATIEALDAGGATIDREVVRDDLGSQPQSFTLDGGEISRVRIRAPSNELLLHEFCSGVEQPGFQGGVVGLFVTGPSPDELGDESPERGRFFRTGAPAARIHDNVVVTPRGHALLLVVAGPVSVADNSFTSRGVGRQPDFLKRLQGGAGQLAAFLQGGACAFVYNVGRAPLLPGAFSRLGADMRVHAERLVRPAEGTLRLAAAVSDRLLPDGRVLFHGNQVTLEATDAAPEPGFMARAAAINLPRLNPGAVVLFSFDDVSLQDNQVVAEIAGGAVFFNAAAVAPTVRVSGNRFAEVPQAFYSCVSWGQKNNTTGNQATHCILALGTDVIEVHNQMLFITALCGDLRADVEGTDG